VSGRWRLNERLRSSLVKATSHAGWSGFALLLILALAASLRLQGLGWGLPYSYQDPDEQVVLTHAFRIAAGHLDPHFFLYPSLLFYVIAALLRAISVFYAPHGLSLISRVSFITNPTPYYLAGRTVVVACGIASVYLSYRLGKETFSSAVGLLAALLLAVDPLHVHYSHVAVTDVPATMFGLLALLLFLRAARLPSARTLLAGALAAGLATGTKYNLGLLIIPGAIACWYVYRDQPAVHRGAALAAHLGCRVALPMLAAFLVSTPFALLDLRRFLADFAHQNQIVARGWLGFENVHNGYWYNLSTNLLGSLGLVLLGLALAGLLLALIRRTQADLILAPYVIVYYLYVSSWHELMDRYLLPIVPLLIVLAVRACLALASSPVRRRTVLVAAAAALLGTATVAPALASVSYLRSLNGPDTRTLAKTWIDRHVPAGSAIALEPYGPSLVSLSQLRYYAEVGLTPPSYRICNLPLPLPGTPDTVARLPYLAAHGIDYVVLSSAVDSRVLAARWTYPTVVAFYSDVKHDGRLIARFAPLRDVQGPVVTVYRLSHVAPTTRLTGVPSSTRG
jgi:4-amino-4-deoxy-L-arabinose transferase-like glycosyltransferase